MPWDASEIEGRAGDFRSEYAGGEENPSIVRIARNAFGESGVAIALHRGLVRDAVLVWERETPKILVRPGLESQPARVAFAVAHELGEYILWDASYEEPDVEQVANALAAALLMPREAFSRAYAFHGHDVAALAEEFCAPQGAAALRIGEVSDDPVALVTPRRVHRRDPLEQLPDDSTLYLMARVPPLQ